MFEKKWRCEALLLCDLKVFRFYVFDDLLPLGEG